MVGIWTGRAGFEPNIRQRILSTPSFPPPPLFCDRASGT